MCRVALTNGLTKHYNENNNWTVCYCIQYYSKEDSILCLIILWFTGTRLFKRPLGRSLSSRKVLGKLIHWIEIYPVDNSIHVLNNWGQAVTYKNVKKLCFLNNDWNNDKYELNDVNDKNNIIIIFVVIIIRIVIIRIIIVIVIIIYFYSSNLSYYNPLHLHTCRFATPKLLRNIFF